MKNHVSEKRTRHNAISRALRARTRAGRRVRFTTLPGPENAPTGRVRNPFAILARRRLTIFPTTALENPKSGFDILKNCQPFDLGPVDLSFPDVPTLDFDGDTGLARSHVLPESRRLTTMPRARRQIDLRGQVDAARHLLTPLPRPGESVHALLGGEFVLACAIPVILDAIGQPCELDICTLGTNDAAVDLILREAEAGRVTRFRILLSQYFEQMDRSTCSRVVERIRAAGHVAAVARNHTKLMLWRPQAGSDRFTLEGSANLRSSVNLEQLTITNDRALYDFHQAWLGELLT